MKCNIISDMKEIQLFIYTKKTIHLHINCKKEKWEKLNWTSWTETALLNFLLGNSKFSLVMDAQASSFFKPRTYWYMQLAFLHNLNTVLVAFFESMHNWQHIYQAYFLIL
jgi:hypothetical protein